MSQDAAPSPGDRPAPRGRWRLVAALATAIGLTGCARDTPYDTLRARYASPASRFADLPGGLRVHYRDQGPRDARVVVLVHGYSASLHAWEPWVARLSDRWRLISLDLPGHGLTEAPRGYRVLPDTQPEVVDQLIRRLGVDRFVIAGNSMGGQVAWRYALAHPDRVQGLVLVDAAGWPRVGPAPKTPLVYRLLDTPLGREVAKRMDPRGMAQDGLAQAYVDPRLVTQALVDRYADLARAPGHRDILLTQQTEPRPPVTPADFARIRTPTLVMSGEQDALIPAADARAFAAAIPGARLILYPGVGHVPMEQIPDRSAADVRAFLDGLP